MPPPASQLSQGAARRTDPRRALPVHEIPSEIRGALASAAVGLGILLPVGLLPFAALGAEGAALGIRAAFIAAVIGGAIIALVGGSAVPGSGPRTATALVFAGFIAELAGDPALRSGAGIAWLVALGSACVALAGLMQLLFGAARLGSIVSYVPLPVIAGWMDGVAILIIAAQFYMLFPAGSGVSMSAAVVAAVTALLALVVARRNPRVPWALVGIVFGSVLHWIVTPVFSGPPGALVGAPAAGLALPFSNLHDAPELRAHIPHLLTASVVIAVIGSLESLLSAAAMDTVAMTRHSPNRLLIGHGIANLVVGLLGGMPVSSSIAVQLAMHRAGGRRIAAAITSVLLLFAAMLAAPYALPFVPIAATAGVMLVVSLGIFDQWSSTVWRRARSGARDRDALWALATVAIVCAITVAFGFVLGIAVGIAMSIVLFVAAQNRSLLRSVATAQTRASRRIYRDEEAAALRAHGDSVRIVELEGAVFFGTAHKLERELEAIAEGARCVIVDVHRVTNIDASGTQALERVAARVRANDKRFVLAGIVPGDKHSRALHAHGALVTKHQTSFPDVDRALERAERDILDSLGMPPADHEVPLSEVALFEELDATQRVRLEARLERRELASGEIVFRRGEPGDRVFVLVKGSVTMMGEGDDQRGRRLATFAPGVVFGEAAMLDGGGRTATGVADEPSVVYMLTRDAMEALRREDSALALGVLRNIARQLSARLRFATSTIDAMR
jgi:sulfate permease, SulP family